MVFLLCASIIITTATTTTIIIIIIIIIIILIITVPDPIGATSEYCQIEDRTIVLTKFRCKNYYSLFIEKLVSEPSAVRAWKKSFSELPNWSDCFVNIYKSSKDNKLRQFTFKVVHRIITTKKELLKYKLASDDKCPFCLNPDSTEHTFLYCQE